jgi:hypothetical protein
MARYSVIKPRRGTLYENSVNNVLLDEGELIVEVPDTGVGTGLSKFKIGDGHSRYNDLPYAFNGASAASISGGDASETALIQFRADSTENWEAIDPVLALGEMGYDTIYKWFKVGDGEKRWTQLPWLRDVMFAEGDPTREIVDFGDEDLESDVPMPWEPEFDMVDFGDEDEEEDIDPYAMSTPSVNFKLSTGEDQYIENILPDNWNDKIIPDIIDPDIPDDPEPPVDPDDPDEPGGDTPDPDDPPEPEPEPTPEPTPVPVVPKDIEPPVGPTILDGDVDDDDEDDYGIEEPAEEAVDEDVYELGEISDPYVDF